MKALGVGARTASAAVAAAAIALFGVAPAAHAAEIDVADENLRACINEALGQGAEEPIEDTQAAGITELDCISQSVTDLTGMEHLTNLVDLNLSYNQIDSLAPLSGLASLDTLHLTGNGLSDVSGLATVDSLTMLGLHANSVTDLSPLASLPALDWLYLSSNGITDVSALAGLPVIRTLNLSGNDITDVSPLAGLAGLEALRLDENHIADLSPLAALPQAANTSATDQSVDLGDVTVGQAQSNPVVGTDGAPVALDSLYDAGANTFTPDTAGAGTVSWDDGAAFTGTLTFSASPLVSFPDDALRACINDALGQADDADITAAQAAGIDDLTCAAQGISDLTGIDALTGASTIRLPDNEIVDLSPLAAMDLQGLDISGNHVSDLSPLVALLQFAWVNAQDQTLHLGEVPTDVATANPVVGMDGDPVELSDHYDPATNTLTPTAPGDDSVTWSVLAGEWYAFTGTVQFTAIEEPEPTPEPTAEFGEITRDQCLVTIPVSTTGTGEFTLGVWDDQSEQETFTWSTTGSHTEEVVWKITRPAGEAAPGVAFLVSTDGDDIAEFDPYEYPASVADECAGVVPPADEEPQETPTTAPVADTGDETLAATGSAGVAMTAGLGALLLALGVTAASVRRRAMR